MVLTIRGLTICAGHGEPCEGLIAALRYGRYLRIRSHTVGRKRVPVSTVFELQATRSGEQHVAFTLRHRSGFAFPIIYGSLTVRRFAGIALVTMDTTYDAPRDIATRLFDQAVGSELARVTLKQLFRAICAVLKRGADVTNASALREARP